MECILDHKKTLTLASIVKRQVIIFSEQQTGKNEAYFSRYCCAHDLLRHALLG